MVMPGHVQFLADEAIVLCWYLLVINRISITNRYIDQILF